MSNRPNLTLQRHAVLYENASVVLADTIEIDMYDLEDIEIFGSAATGATTISFQRSIDKVNYYTTDTINVTAGTDIFGKFQCAAPYARLYINNSITGLYLDYSATSKGTL